MALAAALASRPQLGKGRHSITSVLLKAYDSARAVEEDFRGSGGQAVSLEQKLSALETSILVNQHPQPIARQGRGRHASFAESSFVKLAERPAAPSVASNSPKRRPSFCVHAQQAGGSEAGGTSRGSPSIASSSSVE